MNDNEDGLDDVDVLARVLVEKVDASRRDRVIADAEYIARNINYIEQVKGRLTLAGKQLGRIGCDLPLIDIVEQIDPIQTLSLQEICERIVSRTWTEWTKSPALLIALAAMYGRRVQDALVVFPQEK